MRASSGVVSCFNTTLKVAFVVSAAIDFITPAQFVTQHIFPNTFCYPGNPCYKMLVYSETHFVAKLGASAVIKMQRPHLFF